LNTIEKELENAGFGEVRPRVWAREGRSALLERLAGVDLFATDFDECMHPDITQAETGMAVYRKIAASVYDPHHFALYANMTLFSGPIIAIKLYQKLTGDVKNSRMIGTFQKLARGIPVQYFEEAAEPLVGRFFPGVADTLRLLNRRGVPAGVISLGIDIVIGEMLRRLEEREQARVDFFDCTRVEVDAHGCFRRYDPKHAYYNNEDKRTLLRARVEKLGAKRPLVVGHDRDDMMMFDEAVNLEGVTVGFRPRRETLALLDIAVTAGDWTPIHELLKDALNH